jgi:hypothetical protein
LSIHFIASKSLTFPRYLWVVWRFACLRIAYYQKAVIRPDKTWKRIEIPFDDLVPTLWTKHNVNYYSDKPDLQNIIGTMFMFSSWDTAGGRAETNTVWIDEVKLE